jgi:Tol biopolymer transport system component
MPAAAGGPKLIDITRLTWGHANHEHPVVAPDGQRLAYYDGEFGWIQLHVTGVDGRGARPLTCARGNHTQASWSPDGRHVYYRRQAGPGTPWEIWRVAVDDPDDKLCLLADRKVSFKHPSVSPDGKTLAWFSDAGSPANFHLFTGELRGRKVARPRQLTAERERNDCHPTWSPDGKQLTFHAYMGATDAATSHCYVIAAAGGEARRITDSAAFHKHPFFVGRDHIVHHTEDDERRYLVLRRADTGEKLARLTTGKHNDKHPSPYLPARGGAKLVWSSKKRGEEHEGEDKSYDVFIGTLTGVRLRR